MSNVVPFEKQAKTLDEAFAEFVEAQAEGLSSLADARVINLNNALRHHRNGLRVFPVQLFRKSDGKVGKKPRVNGWTEGKVYDEGAIRGWFTTWPEAVIGIVLAPADGSYKLAVRDFDLPVEIAKAGYRLRFGETEDGLRVETVSGGEHGWFRNAGPHEVPTSSKNRPSKKARLPFDIKANGFVVAPGSVHCEFGYYDLAFFKPDDLEDLPASVNRAFNNIYDAEPLNLDAAREGAITALEQSAPAVQGDGGDQTTYNVACKVKDYGIDEDTCFELMQEHYNPRCVPPWSDLELRKKVENAYKFAKGQTLSQAIQQDAAVEFTPLYVDLGEAAPYPMEALGALKEPAEALARIVQMPHAIAAQCVLATATLAAQAEADIRSPLPGEPKPLSNLFMSVAISGDRKSTADDCALVAVDKIQAQLMALHKHEEDSYLENKADFDKLQKELKDSKKTEDELLELAKKGRNEPPKPPKTPFLRCSSPTIEGLTKLLKYNVPFIGVFSSEAAQFIGGHAMSPDAKKRSAAGLSKLWDKGAVDHVTATDNATFLTDRRLCMHLMGQPDLMADFLADDILTDQGFLSRVLVAYPTTIMGTRMFRRATVEDEATVQNFSVDVANRLAGKCGYAVEGSRLARKEGKPDYARFVLTLDDEAEQVWIAFHDEVEAKLGKGCEYETIRGLGSKLPEHAVRLAGVIATATLNPLGDRETEVDAPTMRGGVVLARWYAGEALRLFGRASISKDLKTARQVFEKIKAKWPDEIFTGRDVQKINLVCVNTKQKRDRVLETLRINGHIERVAGPGNSERWKITDAAKQA